VRSSWMANLSKKRTAHASPAAKAEAEAKEANAREQRRTRTYHAILTGYATLSMMCGVWATAACLGWNCGQYRTCARPPCNILERSGGVLPLLQVDPALLLAGNDFTTTASAFTARTRMMAIVPEQDEPSGQREWNFQIVNNLQYEVQIGRRSDGEVRLTFIVSEQPATQGTSSSNGLQMSTPSTGDSWAVERRFSTTLPSCVSTFKPQCQELHPRLAHQHKSSPWEFVEYTDPADQIFKLVLDDADGVPSCWKDDISLGAATGWWHDLLLFGPNITAGHDASGRRILGLVMENFNKSTNSVTGGDAGQCLGGSQCGAYSGQDACNINPPCQWSGGASTSELRRALRFAPNIVFGPDYGRNPVYGSWQLRGASAEQQAKAPSRMASVSYGMEFDVQPHNLECTSWTHCTWGAGGSASSPAVTGTGSTDTGSPGGDIVEGGQPAVSNRQQPAAAP